MISWKSYVVLRNGDEFVGVWRDLKTAVGWLMTTDLCPDDVTIQRHDLAGSYDLDPDEFTDEIVSWRTEFDDEDDD